MGQEEQEMTDGKIIHGQCMCGAISVTAERGKPVIRACHCDMCRQWTSSMFLSVPTRPGSIKVRGPVKTFRSSAWAERGFCAECGSSLWYETRHDGMRNLAAGLFENAAGNTLRTEFYGDSCPEGYAFEGTHRRLSNAETQDLFNPDRGGS